MPIDCRELLSVGVNPNEEDDVRVYLILIDGPELSQSSGWRRGVRRMTAGQRGHVQRQNEVRKAGAGWDEEVDDAKVNKGRERWIALSGASGRMFVALGS